jgi:L-lactate utilization protein LutC
MVPLLSLGLIADLAGLPDEAVLLCKSLPLRVWHAIATDRVKRAKLLQFLRQEFPLEEWRHPAEETTSASEFDQDGITHAQVAADRLAGRVQ